MKMTWRLCAALVAVAAGLCLSSCGSDDNDDNSEVVTPPAGSGGSIGGSGTGGSTKLNLVGRTYGYYQRGSEHGYDNSLNITLKFISSTQCAVTKDSWYYKWQNSAYRQFHYQGTKTASYTVAGNRVTVNGAWPFWDGSRSESWDNDAWTLDYDPQYSGALFAADADSYDNAFSLINN